MRALQIVGGRSQNGYANSNTFDSPSEECDWADIDADLYYWTKALRPVQVSIFVLMKPSNSISSFRINVLILLAIEQWYPGHIAKTEKELKEQLKLMDVVIEVRDARIPLSTSHPQVSVCVCVCVLIILFFLLTWMCRVFNLYDLYFLSQTNCQTPTHLYLIFSPSSYMNPGMLSFLPLRFDSRDP